MARIKGTDKAAILMAAIGAEHAARIMGALDDDERDRIGQAMVELEDMEMADDTTGEVVEEFRNMLFSGKSLRSHLGRTLRGMLDMVYGDDAGKRLARIREEARDRFPFRGLRGIKARDLARVLLDEHPQVRALVLANIDSHQAADVLEEFPEEEQMPIVYRMATMEEPSPRLLKQVAHEMIDRARGLRREEFRDPAQGDPRFKIVADILNATHAGADKDILERIEEEDKDVSTSIRERMFTWDDIVVIDKRTMQKILAGVDTRLLALALKSCDEKVKESLLSSVSRRTRDMIVEEKELLGAVPLTDVLDAQKQILATVRGLIDAGEIAVGGGGTLVK